MKKKNYVSPSVTMVLIRPTELICASITSDVGIGYGGVDEDGTNTVDSRRRHTLWDEDE